MTCSVMAYVLALFVGLALSLLCLAQTNAGTITTPFLPSSWPLAVKGPYLNSWQAGEIGGTPLPLSSPAFWPAWDDVSVTPFFLITFSSPRHSSNNLDMYCGRRRCSLQNHGHRLAEWSPQRHISESNRYQLHGHKH